MGGNPPPLKSPPFRRAGSPPRGGGGGAKTYHFTAATMRECLPGACPAHYLCIKYLISSPKLILTLGSPPSRPH